MGTLKYFDPETGQWVPVSESGGGEPTTPGEPGQVMSIGSDSESIWVTTGSPVYYHWDGDDYVQQGNEIATGRTRVFKGPVDPETTLFAPLNMWDEWVEIDLAP